VEMFGGEESVAPVGAGVFVAAGYQGLTPLAIDDRHVVAGELAVVRW